MLTNNRRRRVKPASVLVTTLIATAGFLAWSGVIVSPSMADPPVGGPHMDQAGVTLSGVVRDFRAQGRAGRLPPFSPRRPLGDRHATRPLRRRWFRRNPSSPTCVS